MTLLGEVTTQKSRGQFGDAAEEDDDPDVGAVPLGNRVKRWFKQSGLTAAMLEPIFHHEGGKVQIIAAEVPGNGKKAQTKNCYLLEGARCFLEKDEAKFAEADVVALCKHLGCHDSANHATNRKSLGNVVTGTKDSGFTLPAPGLKEAAALIKEMATS
ncbi:MAG: hypothetical protein CMJ31_05825 [Phycisphaerae bacterium]|nr:hypothetical protein [Phycisphaerae bacterium]